MGQKSGGSYTIDDLLKQRALHLALDLSKLSRNIIKVMRNRGGGGRFELVVLHL